MSKKKKKGRPIEKETKKLIEATSDVLKRKGDGYRFKKVSKKVVKKLKRTCCHWVMRKGKPHPAVISTADGFMKCKICGATFRTELLTTDQYKEACRQFLSIVNQVFFYSVSLGGDSSDTRIMLRLKECLPHFKKMLPNVNKFYRKMIEHEKQSMKRSSRDSEFGGMDVEYC